MTEYRIPKGVKVVTEDDLPAEDYERIILPEGAVSIEDFSFFGLPTLREVVFPEGFESIGMSVFDGSAIERVVFPASLKTLGHGAFRDCRKLQSVVFLGEGPEIIESTTFEDCTSLKTVTFGTGLKVTGSETMMDYGGAFEGCVSLEEAILPEGMVLLGNGTFRGCTSLARVVLPKSLTAIGERALAETAIRELIVPDGVTDCFNVAPLCANLERVVIPCTVRALSLKVFNEPALKEVVLPRKFEEDFELYFPDDARERMKITFIDG